MGALDSRYLHYGDTFTQGFSKPGEAVYWLRSAAGFPARPSKFTIEVKERGPGVRQHDVRVYFEEGRLEAEPASLEINAGDLVMWCAQSSKTPPFAVSGELPEGRFDSSAMMDEAVYSHAFGLPGEIQWHDANGSGLRGTVRVVSPQLRTGHDREEYMKLLTNGQLVMIRGEKAEPESVEIYTGQTVFWAVEKAGGITITEVSPSEHTSP